MTSVFDSKTKIWHGPPIKYPYPMNVMLSDLIFENLSKTPNRILQITEKDDLNVTCEDLKINSIRVAQNLSSIGIDVDDVVGLILCQSHFTTFLLHGCVFLGAIPNTFDFSFGEEDIRHVFMQSKPKIIICDIEGVPKLKSALKDVDFKFQIYTTSADSSTYPSALQFLSPTKREQSFTPPKFSKLADEKIFAILCSSGTTGIPKGVCITHTSLLTSFHLLLSSQPNTRSLNFIPPIFGSGFIQNFDNSFTLSNITIFTSRSFTVENFIEIVQKYKITNVFMPPSQLAVLLDSEKFSSSNMDSLKHIKVGGSIASENMRRKFEKVFPNQDLTIVYGMTEVGVVITKPYEFRHKLSVGSSLLPNVAVKIVDDNGNVLNNREIGEICAKAQFKFIGYYNNPEATANILDKDCFVKTGDIGYFNDNGMLFVIDRKKDIIKYKGYHVNPSEIENLIESMEGVDQVSVVGIPDDFCQNLITAAVVKRKNYENLTEEEIVTFVSGKFPSHKHLSGGVRFFEKFPKTPVGKIKRIIILEKIKQNVFT